MAYSRLMSELSSDCARIPRTLPASTIAHASAGNSQAAQQLGSDVHASRVAASRTASFELLWVLVVRTQGITPVIVDLNAAK